MNAKNKVVIVSVVLIAALLVSAFGVTRLFGDEYAAQAQKIFDDAREKVEQIRNVTITGHINLHVITKEDAKNMWGTPSSNVDLTNIYRQEKIYKGLFMMPENDSLYEATGDWVANWGAATVGKHDIYVIRENFDPFDKNAEATFIHELTHIWQPQLTNPTTYDEDKAHAALVEGDASFMGDYYLNTSKAQASSAQASLNSPFFVMSLPWLDNVYPMTDTLWSLNFFPYDQGKTFVNAVYQQGGFTLINQAYNASYTPSTVTQILHPDKYFANQTAQQVNAPTLKEGGWTVIPTDRGPNHNTYGEYFIQTMLGTWIDEDKAKSAADGWLGDNFTYYERGQRLPFTLGTSSGQATATPATSTSPSTTWQMPQEPTATAVATGLQTGAI